MSYEAITHTVILLDYPPLPIRIAAQIVTCQGPSEFRRRRLAAYHGQCTITPKTSRDGSRTVGAAAFPQAFANILFSGARMSVFRYVPYCSPEGDHRRAGDAIRRVVFFLGSG